MVTKILPFLALTLIVGLIGLYFGTSTAEAQRAGPYMLVAHSNETANVGIFRIDTGSGAVSFCYLESAANAPTLRCTNSAN